MQLGADVAIRADTDRRHPHDRPSAGNEEASFDRFLERWRATRKIFFVPSYARILTLYAPVLDGERQRIGYWRVVLPRTSWMLRRVAGYRKRTDYADLPLDLVPDLPLTLWVLEQTRTREGQIFKTLRSGGYRAVDVRYELLGKPYRHDPRRGFRRTRIEVRLQNGDESAELLLTAEVSLNDGEPRLKTLKVGYPTSVGRSDDTHGRP